MVRSSSAQVVSTIRSSGVPSACRIVTRSSPVAPSTASLISRQHPVGVGVGDEQRTAFAGRRRGEVVTVDEADARLHRVDAEPGPGDVEERHGREDDEVDVVALAQEADRAFEHER